jgi:hypothetical protein
MQQASYRISVSEPKGRHIRNAEVDGWMDLNEREGEGVQRVSLIFAVKRRSSDSLIHGFSNCRAMYSKG